MCPLGLSVVQKEAVREEKQSPEGFRLLFCTNPVKSIEFEEAISFLSFDGMWSLDFNLTFVYSW